MLHQYSQNKVAQTILKMVSQPKDANGIEFEVVPSASLARKGIATTITDIMRSKRLLALRALSEEKMENAKPGELAAVIKVLGESIEKMEILYPDDRNDKNKLTEDEQRRINETVFRAIEA